MTRTEYEILRQSHHEAALAVANAKRKDYAANPGTGDVDDVLYNFKQVAERAGVSPKIVWLVYLTKHIMSIEKWARGETLASEPIEGRMQDITNYIDLGLGLHAELDAPVDDSCCLVGSAPEPSAIDDLLAQLENQPEPTHTTPPDNPSFLRRLLHLPSAT